MKISELAKRAGVTKDTIRHYVAIGLLNHGVNPDNGYQIFDKGSLARLRFIKEARQLGFRLEEVAYE